MPGRWRVIGRKFAFGLVAVLVSALISMPPLAAQTPHFDPIEYSGDRTKSTDVAVNGMSADGTFIVGSQNLNYNYPGFVWHNGVMTDPCFNLPVQLNIPDSCRMTGVANNGAMVGWYSQNDVGKLVVWGGGQSGPYQPPCPRQQGCRSGAMATNGVFLVADGSGWTASTVLNSASYSAALISPGANSSQAYGLNSNGMWVAGGEQYIIQGMFYSHPFYAYNGTTCDLDPNDALGGSAANAISETGNIVVGLGALAKPIIWDQISSVHCTGTPHVLPTTDFGPSFTAGFANAVSSDGGVVVGRVEQNASGPTAYKAFRWTCANGLESIEQLLTDSGAGYRDLSNLWEARSISSDGTVIAGVGADTNGVNPRAWRAVLPRPGTPTFALSPATNMTFKGAPGAAVNGSYNYQLSRSTGGNVFTVTNSISGANWLSVNVPTGKMTSTATALVFTVNANAKSLPIGVYQATVTITYSNLYCTLGSDTRTVTLTIAPAAAHDFNGDGQSDIVWRDGAGNIGLWLMNGATISSSAGFYGNPLTYGVVGQRDFDGDGKTDLLWRGPNGETVIWFFNGLAATGVGINQAWPTSWSVAGTGDFDGDGKADIMFRDTNAFVAFWLMNGTAVKSAAQYNSSIGTAWSIVGVGDFNGDGKADIVFRDTSSYVAIWIMNGTTIADSAVYNPIGTVWSIVETGDYNHDGKADIVLRDTSAHLWVWTMNGKTVSSAAFFPDPGLSWSFVGQNAD